MVKQSDTHSSRAVTATDLEVIDQAIGAHEGLGRFLYTTRRILGEIGKLEEQYRGTKEGLAVVQAEAGRIASELEAAKTQLAAVRAQEVEKRKVVAELTAESEEKRRELEAYSQSIDRIMGTRAA